MELWIVYAFASTLFTGLQSFALKVIVVRGYSTNIINSYALVVAAALGLITVSLFFGFEGNYALGIALAAATGIVYMWSTIARTRSLRYLGTAVVFPVYKSLTVLIATIAGIALFGETLSTSQTLGIALVFILPLFALSVREFRGSKKIQTGIRYLLFASAMGAFSAIINKFGAPLFHTALMFGVFNYLFGTVTGFSQQIYEHWHPENKDHWFLDRRFAFVETAGFVFVLGVLIFLAFSTLMLALQNGPLSIVYTVNSLYFVIPVILSALFLGEKNKRTDVAMTILSLVAVLLLI